MNRNAINQIAVQGLDTWNVAKSANQNTHLLCRHALCAYAAHASTHSTERLVKLGALMVSTGKSEIMASIFVIVSNNCMQQYKDKNEETHQEPPNQPAEGPTGGAEDNNGPQRRKQGNQGGKKKLFDLQRVVLKKEQDL
jgi:hypothetical protein